MSEPAHSVDNERTSRDLLVDIGKLAAWFCVAMYVSIALHELAHYFACVALDVPVKQISLFAGGWTHTFHGASDWIIGFNAVGSNHVMPANPKMHVASASIIIFAGPLMNIIIAGITWKYFSLDNNIVTAFFMVNVSAVVVGLYPAGGTDGHQLLQVAKLVYQGFTGAAQ